MTTNPVDSSFTLESVSDMSKVGTTPSTPAQVSNGKYLLLISQASLNILAYSLIGIVVGVNLVFSYRFGPNLSSVNLHIVLCVLGFQLLMGVAILALAPESGFTASITLKHKRWIHSFLQVVGSAIALAGCFIVCLWKNINFNTVHGQTALASMIFTIACLFNGVASLYAYEWRKWLPSSLSKITHILFGIAAFGMANVSLCYGMEKNSFRNWATNEFTVALYYFTGAFTAICFINPTITLFTKFSYSRSH